MMSRFGQLGMWFARRGLEIPSTVSHLRISTSPIGFFNIAVRKGPIYA